MDAILNQLLQSGEPAVRYQAHTRLVGEDLPELRQAVSTCARVQALLSDQLERMRAFKSG